jgi:hypothetical protein
MEVVFLEGVGQLRKLAKTFIRRDDGSIEKHAYPNAARMTSYSEEVSTVDEFATALKNHAKEYRALFTGHLIKPLKGEPRKGMATKNNKMDWVCLDLDGVDADSVEQVVSEIPQLENTSYVVAYSASHGFKDGVNAHVFFLLDTPARHDKLVTLVTAMNWYTPRLREQLRLSESKMSLTKKLDTAGVRAAGLIYIAPPVLKGLDDPCTDIDGRIRVVHKGKDTLSLNTFPSTWLDDTIFKIQMRDRLNELRKMEGLPPVANGKTTVDVDGMTVEYNAEPDPMTIQLVPGPVNVNGMVRCNVNGGDSGAYYFNYGYISDGAYGSEITLMQNFKGDAPFALMKAAPVFAQKWNDWVRQEEAVRNGEMAVPEWLKQCPTTEYVTEAVKDIEDTEVVGEKKELSTEEMATARTIIFRDGNSDTHYELSILVTGTPVFKKLSPASAKTRANALGIRYSKEDGFPTLHMVFDPRRPEMFFELDGEAMVNTFAAPKLIDFAAPKTIPLEDVMGIIKEKCPVYYTSIMHPLSYDLEAAKRFVNWATIHVLYPNTRVNTAWLLRGIPGSGKSTIVSDLLSRLLGYGHSEHNAGAYNGYCSTVKTSTVASDFSGWQLNSRFIEVSEAETDGNKHRNNDAMKQEFKRLVTQEQSDINEKYGAQRKNVNVFNAYVFTSNYHDTFPIDLGDRRYHVPKYQSIPIKDVLPVIADDHNAYRRMLDSEAKALGDIMSRLIVDQGLAQQPYDCGDKAEIIEAGQSVGDLFIGWIKTGDFDRIADAVVSSVEMRSRNKGIDSVDQASISYVAYVCSTGETVHSIPRGVLQQIYTTAFPTASNMSSTAFSRKLGAAGVTPKPGRPTAGMRDLLGLSNAVTPLVEVNWTVNTADDWLAHPLIAAEVDGMRKKQEVLRMVV